MKCPCSNSSISNTLCFLSNIFGSIFIRLQKDLDAARSGTGFYVDKENYQKMLDAISAVTGETISADELTARKAERIKNLGSN